MYGIYHEFSTTRTAQQNGVLERKNRALQEMARMMLNTTTCLITFGRKWSIRLAILQIMYLRETEKRTPYEHSHGRKPT